MSIYLPALIGGILIGLASAIYLLFNGRIMGASGILGAVTSLSIPGDWKERVAFIVGILSASFVYQIFAPLPAINITSNIILLIVAGLLVGFGSRLGSGCTSGHGVCGLGRLSKRSFISVCIFMAAAIITVYVQNHVIGG